MSREACQPQYGITNPSPEDQAAMPIKRFGSVIGLNPEKEQYYRELHANVWPSIIAADPETRHWWKETDPCQIPLPARKEGSNWSDMEMVFMMED